MLNWLNDNAGAVQALGTIVLVGITYWYVHVTRAILKETRRSQRPYIYLDVTSDGGPSIDLAVGNLGDRAAESVTFEIIRDVTERDGALFSAREPFARGIAYLPPQRRYEWSFVVDTNIFGGELNEHVLEVEVKYRYGAQELTDRVRIDFATFDGVRLSSFRDGTYDIAQQLKNMRSDRRTDQHFQFDMSPPKRTCPTCREQIDREASKCRFCMEPVPPLVDTEQTERDDPASPE